MEIQPFSCSLFMAACGLSSFSPLPIIHPQVLPPLPSPRYQAKCDRLQLSNDQLEGKLSQQLEDQEQMITFLKRKSQEQMELNLDLEEKSTVLRQAKENEVGGGWGSRGT